MRRSTRSGLCALAVLAVLLSHCQSDEPPALPPGGDCAAGDAAPLNGGEILSILFRAAAAADITGRRATFAVVNRQGDLLAAYQMNGADPFAVFDPEVPVAAAFRNAQLPSHLVAWTKAGTGAFLSSCGHAFSTRTAAFIIQEHFPPKIDFQPGGPLFGVQFSSLPCSDVMQLPLGLAGDPGGLPLYRGGQLVGGIGVEVDGVYTLDRAPADPDPDVQLDEEAIAMAAAFEFAAPAEIRADQIVVNGIRFPYVEAEELVNTGFVDLDTAGRFLVRNFDGGPSKLRAAVVPGRRVEDEDVDEQLDCPDQIVGQSLTGLPAPVFSPGGLTQLDVTNILGQAACRAVTARAAIRRPLGSAVQVNITVVDRDGRILGMFRTKDAPIFGADVSVQKARSAAFMSDSRAAARLQAAGLGRYVAAAAEEDVVLEGRPDRQLRLDGQIAFSARGFGFLARPFLPDGINGTAPGPFSLAHPDQGGQWSVFNTGLQLDLVAPGLLAVLGGQAGFGEGCRPELPALANGFQIFAGAVPLFKAGALVGAVGVSGDGIDQDDLVSLAGSIGFEAPVDGRSDTVIVLRDEDGEERRTRLPYVKLPRNPNLGE